MDLLLKHRADARIKMAGSLQGQEEWSRYNYRLFVKIKALRRKIREEQKWRDELRAREFSICWNDRRLVECHRLCHVLAGRLWGYK